MSRTPALVTLVLSAWLSGLVLAAAPLGFESPLALRHPSAPVPRFEPPRHLCEPRFALGGCELREDLSAEGEAELHALLAEHGAAVERWRLELRAAVLTGGWWRGAWPFFALAWSALAALLAGRALRSARHPAATS